MTNCIIISGSVLCAIGILIGVGGLLNIRKMFKPDYPPIENGIEIVATSFAVTIGIIAVGVVGLNVIIYYIIPILPCVQVV